MVVGWGGQRRGEGAITNHSYNNAVPTYDPKKVVGENGIVR